MTRAWDGKAASARFARGESKKLANWLPFFFYFLFLLIEDTCRYLVSEKE